MSPSPIRFFIRREDFDSITVIDLVRALPDGSREIALPVTMQHVKELERNPDSHMLVIDRKDEQQALQSLMDQLWNLGVRPSDIGTPGHLAATQAHLNDFRAIVAKTLDVQLKQ